MFEAIFQEIGERFAEIRVRAILDNQAGAFFGSKPTQVGKSLFRHENHGIVIRLVHMAHVRHNRTDGAVLGNRGRQENAKVTVAGKVCRATDSVHHGRARNKAAVHVTEDVGFERRVHRNHTHAANHVGTVAHFLLAKYQMLFPFGGVFHKFFLCVFRQSKSRARSDAEFALL